MRRVGLLTRGQLNETLAYGRAVTLAYGRAMMQVIT